MGEKNLVINNRKIKYSGMFRTDELLSTINHALQQKGYAKSEKKSEELVTADGRLIQVELRPSRRVSPYMVLLIKIHLVLDNVTETSKEVAGTKKKFQQGDVLIAFDSWSMTDHEGRWSTKPFNYFMKAVIHKYVYKFPREENFIRDLVVDTAYIYAQIKNLLESYNGQKIPPMKEEAILQKVEEEMAKNE